MGKKASFSFHILIFDALCFAKNECCTIKHVIVTVGPSTFDCCVNDDNVV